MFSTASGLHTRCINTTGGEGHACHTRHSFAGIAFLTLTACTSAPSVSEIPASFANATIATDPQRIATYFAGKAASYDAEAAWHEKMALSYAARPKGGLGAIMAHCRLLKEQFANAARDARTLEQAHRQLAGSPG